MVSSVSSVSSVSTGDVSLLPHDPRKRQRAKPVMAMGFVAFMGICSHIKFVGFLNILRVLLFFVVKESRVTRR